MKVLTTMAVELDQREVERVVDHYLESLTRGEWVRPDRKGNDVLMHEVATSHKFDTEVDYQDPVRIKMVKAVQDFRAALKEYRKSFEKDGRK